MNNEVRKTILPFVATYHPAFPNFKNILMSKWHLIQNQPLLREIYEPPIISCKRAKSLGDILIRATIRSRITLSRGYESCLARQHLSPRQCSSALQSDA